MQGSIAWDDLRYLLAAIRDGSFAAAARRLHVDPATVGRRLRALQRAVGAPLLERSPGRLSLTAAGERALRAAEQMDAAALHLERVVDAGLPAVEGVLRIGATEGLADRVVAPRLPELLARHPALHLELITSNQAANLSRREADVAVRLFRPAEPALAARRAGLLAFGLYAAAGYLRRRGRPAGPRLEGHDLLGYERGLATRSGALGWPDELGGRVVLRATSTGALLAAAAAGAGIGLLPCFLADREPDLARVLPALRTRELWLVVHGDLRRTARVRAGLDFLAQVLADAAPLLRGDRPAGLPGPAGRGGRNFTLGD